MQHFVSLQSTTGVFFLISYQKSIFYMIKVESWDLWLVHESIFMDCLQLLFFREG